MTFKKAFNDCFSETLCTYGFQFNKKYGMHVRFVNDEILQYITYTSFPSTVKGSKSYRVFSGASSVYTYSFLKQELLYWGLDLRTSAYLYFGDSMNCDICYTYNEETMLDVIDESMKKTIECMIPILNAIVDLDSYIEYRKKVCLGTIKGADKFEIHQNDALVLIKADNHDNFQELFEEELNKVMKKVEAKLAGGTYEEHYQLLHDSIIEHIVESRDKVYADPELYAKAMKEAERRKEANLELLREYGVIA